MLTYSEIILTFRRAFIMRFTSVIQTLCAQKYSKPRLIPTRTPFIPPLSLVPVCNVGRYVAFRMVIEYYGRQIQKLGSEIGFYSLVDP